MVNSTLERAKSREKIKAVLESEHKIVVNVELFSNAVLQADGTTMA